VRKKLSENLLDTNYEISFTLKRGQALTEHGLKPEKNVDENGEILDGRSARLERFSLQSAAKKLLPNERVSRCLRYPIPNQEIEVWRHIETCKSFYVGLGVCGSVWVCPMCSAKISERRRIELKKCITQHSDNKGFVAMLTLTVRHNYMDDLQLMLIKLTKAMTRFRTGKRYHNLTKQIKLIGTIRALELTHGKNGWHPHFHILIFYETKQNLKKLINDFYSLWSLACQGSGLDTSKDAISLQDAEQASDYASKWGVESEMTKSNSKRGGFEKGRTPFDILRDYLFEPKQRDEILFKNYAIAFKGKQQLVWSRGLKKLFDLDEIDDEAIANKKEEKADILGIIPYYIWKMATHNKDLRNSILELTEDMDFDVAIDAIKDICYTYKLNSNLIHFKGKKNTSASLAENTKADI